MRTRFPALRTLPSSSVATLSFWPITRRSSVLPLNWNDDVRAGDPQLGDPRQRVEQLLGQAVGEVFVVLVAAHVHERKHRD